MLQSNIREYVLGFHVLNPIIMSVSDSNNIIYKDILTYRQTDILKLNYTLLNELSQNIKVLWFNVLNPIRHPFSTNF